MKLGKNKYTRELTGLGRLQITRQVLAKGTTHTNPALKYHCLPSLGRGIAISCREVFQASLAYVALQWREIPLVVRVGDRHGQFRDAGKDM